MVDGASGVTDPAFIVASGLFIGSGGLLLLYLLFQKGRFAEQVLNKKLSTFVSEQIPDTGEQLATILRPQKRYRAWLLVWSVSKSCTVLVGAGCICLLFSLGNSLPASLGIGMMIGGGLPLFVRHLRDKKRRKLLSSQFPEALDLMVRGARVGVTAEENMQLAARELPAPLSDVFKQMSEQLKIGISVEQVMSDTAKKLKIREFRYMAATLSVQRRTGGPYAEILENLSLVLREHHEQSRRVEAATSEARLAAKIVSSLVFLSFGLLFFLNRTQFDFLLDDPDGQELLLYCVGSLGLGCFTMYRMLEMFKR